MFRGRRERKGRWGGERKEKKWKDGMCEDLGLHNGGVSR